MNQMNAQKIEQMIDFCNSAAAVGKPDIEMADERMAGGIRMIPFGKALLKVLDGVRIKD